MRSSMVRMNGRRGLVMRRERETMKLLTVDSGVDGKEILKVSENNKIINV